VQESAVIVVAESR